MIKVTTNLVAFGMFAFAEFASAEVILEQNVDVSAGTEYHTNLQLQQDNNKQSVWLYNIIPKYTMSALDGVNEWYGTAGLNIVRSSNSTVSKDREDPNAEIGWRHELERGDFGIKANYTKASTRESQFQDTGVVIQDGSSIAKSIVASYSHLITSSLNYTGDLGYEKTSFTGVTTLKNYSLGYLNNVFSYKYNEMISPYVGIRLNDYRSSDVINTRTKYQEYLVGSELELSPKLTLNIGTGFVHFSPTSKNRLIGLVDVSYKGERYTLTGNIGRTVLPTGLGNIDIADRLAVAYGYDLTEKSSVGVDYGMGKNKATSLDTTQLGAFYNRELTEKWVMRLTYNFRDLKIQGAPKVEDHAAGILFTYKLPNF